MAGVKISDLSTLTPLGTDLVVLDRPTTGAGAPVTGKATLTSIGAVIGGGGGATSGTFNEPSPSQLVTTATVSFAGSKGFSYSASTVGSDTYFFVSGVIGGKDSATPSVGVFGGDLHVSGNISSDGNATVTDLLTIGQDIQVAGVMGVTGSSQLSGGISGSLTQLVSGISYLVAGTNVTITSASNGQVTISSTGGEQYWTSTTNQAIYTSGSALFRGPGGVNGADSPADLGTDVFFYVSGSIGSKNTAVTGTAVFGGDLHTSGNLSADGNATVSQFVSVGNSLQVVGVLGVTGSAGFLAGVTGSLYYSASNAAHWNGTAPTSVAAALNRIASFINTNIGPIT